MRVSKLIAAILVAVALLPVAAAQAGAHGDYVYGGEVHLKLASGMRERLAKKGVRLVGLRPAWAGRSGLSFPISTGHFGVKAGKGYVDLEGGFKLVAGKRTVRVDHLILYTGIHAIKGLVDGRRRIEVANFPAQQPTFDGFNRDLRLNWLKPSAQIAALISDKLSIGRTFTARRSLGSATAVVVFESLAVRSGEITLRVDPSFEDKLTSVEATIGVSGSAKLLGASPAVISMPIEGGQISPRIASGMLLTQGGFFFDSISLARAELFLDGHFLDGDVFDSHGPLPGLFARLPYLGTSIQADPSSGEISSSPLPAMLEVRLVKSLNAALGAPRGRPKLFTEGETFGTVAFRVQTR